MKHFLKCKHLVYATLLCLGIFTGCKDDTDGLAKHDPKSPVEITDFTPKEGSVRTRMCISGKNFGNDASQISVKIGGQKAKVVGSNGELIYCLVPFRASEGTVEVFVGPDSAYAKASENFMYQKKTMVSTLCGYVDETGKKEVKDGSFETCGFEGPMWLTIDPKNKNHIYMTDGTVSIRLLDVEKDSVSTIMQKGQGNWTELRSIGFSAGGDSLFVANHQGADEAIAVSVLPRTHSFKRPQPVVYTRQNATCAAHPVNGELYYNSRSTGELMRYDWETRKSEILYTLKNRDCLYFVFFHPTGNYAYITVTNKKLIMKAEYDWTNKTLKPANIFCGQEGVQGYTDGQGTNATLGNPYQGCFVKNDQYVKEGKEDVYDFYFCDEYAHAVRYVTPEGFVYTYAGRGSQGINSNPDGYVDGDLRQEARFKNPRGIAYDEDNKTFYIGDANNSRIRTIVVDE